MAKNRSILNNPVNGVSTAPFTFFINNKKTKQMLEKDGKKLDFTKKDDPDVKYVLEYVSQLRKISNNDIRLVFTDLRLTRDAEDPGQVERATAFSFPCSETIYKDGVDVKWTYYERKKFGKNADDVKYFPRNIVFTGDKNFNSSNADIGLLFYMIAISPFCEKIPAMDDIELKQNERRTQKAYRVLMPVYDAMVKGEVRKKKSKIENKIWNDMMPDDLLKMALILGINNADKMKDPQRRHAVCDVATSNNDNMELFLEKIKFKPGTELEADIQRAIDQKVITLQKPRGIHRWHFMTDKGWGDMICEVTVGCDDRQFLIDFLKENDKIYQVIKSKLHESVTE